VNVPLLEQSFLLGEEIGQGGTAVVFAATHRSTGEAVVVKLSHMDLDESMRSRIAREARLAAGLKHPNLIRFHGLFLSAEGREALVYQRVEGIDLDVVIASGEPGQELVCDWAEELGSALDALHDAGLVHRDVKPGNVIVDEDGRCLLLDLGLMKPGESGETLTEEGVLVGTPAFMAPEQFMHGKATPQVDQYAMGCLLYQLLTGRPPYMGNPTEIMTAHLQGSRPLLKDLRPDLPEGIQGVLDRSLCRDPEDRYSSCGALARDLRHAWRSREEVVAMAAPTLRISLDPKLLAELREEPSSPTRLPEKMPVSLLRKAPGELPKPLGGRPSPPPVLLKSGIHTKWLLFGVLALGGLLLGWWGGEPSSSVAVRSTLPIQVMGPSHRGLLRIRCQRACLLSDGTELSPGVTEVAMTLAKDGILRGQEKGNSFAVKLSEKELHGEVLTWVENHSKDLVRAVKERSLGHRTSSMREGLQELRRGFSLWSGWISRALEGPLPKKSRLRLWQVWQQVERCRIQALRLGERPQPLFLSGAGRRSEGAPEGSGWRELKTFRGLQLATPRGNWQLADPLSGWKCGVKVSWSWPQATSKGGVLLALHVKDMDPQAELKLRVISPEGSPLELFFWAPDSEKSKIFFSGWLRLRLPGDFFPPSGSLVEISYPGILGLEMAYMKLQEVWIHTS
jgi:serine/threonine protein kinase